MNDNTKRLLLIGGSLIVIGGVVYYFYNKSKSSKPGIVDTDGDGIPDSEDSTPNGEPITITPGGTGGGGTGGGGTVVTTPTALNTVEKIKAFQDWMDKNHPLWIKDTDGKYKNLRVGTASEPNRHIGGKGYGVYGPSTKSAFTLFGSSYSPSTIGGGKTIPADVEKAISLILAKGTGPKVKREYLEMRDPSWLKLWAFNLDNDKSAFVWGGKTFRTKTGDVVLDINPIEVAVKVKANGTNAYEFPTTTSQKIGVAGGTNVGKVRAVSYNQDALWFYLPDNGGNYKWGLANYFVKA
jgi:hypothetical protein